MEQSPAGCEVWDPKRSALLEVQRLGQGVDSVIGCQSKLCITARNCVGAEDPVPFLKKRSMDACSHDSFRPRETRLLQC